MMLARAGRAATLILALALGSCGGGGGGGVKSGYLADSDPNPGVRRAHSLPVQGIDVAKYQGTIDWPRVKASGIRFAYLKVSEGGDHIDSRFYDNWEGARRAGLPRGAYHFMYWCRTASEQAVWFSQAVPQDSGQLPPVLDLEWNNESATCPQHVPRPQALAMINTLLQAMERHTGKRPVIYTDINFYKDIIQDEYRGYEFWLRSVAAEPRLRFANRPWTFWQYTATGRVPGINAPVDRNAFHGTEREWRRWLAGRGIKP